MNWQFLAAILAAVLSLFSAHAQLAFQAPTAPAPSALAAAAVEPAEPSIQHVITYTVQAGDTLSEIAQTFDVPLTNILAANGLSDKAVLHLGEELTIPNPQRAPALAQQPVALGYVQALATTQQAPSIPSDPSPSLNATAFVTQSELSAQLQELTNALTAKFNPAASPVPEYVAADGNPVNPFAAENAINNLSNVTITNANLTTSEIPDLSATYLTLTGGTVSGNITVDGTASVISPLTVSATSTLNGLVLTNLNCSSYGNGGKLTTDGLGDVVCGADQGGAGSTVAGTDEEIQFNSGGAFAASPSFTFASSTALLRVTSASTTNITASYASTSNLVVSNSFTLGNATGILKAVAGAVSAALVNLASDVTGVLPVANGGTGWANVAAGAIPYGNGSSALATTTVGTPGYVLAYLNGVPTWTATSTASASTNGYLASSDWTNFNGKLASSSLATSALVKSLVSDATGSGSLVFATSPTFAGTPVFSGGVISDSVNSTTTIPNSTPYAWTVATSTSASPLIDVDTTGNTGSVSIGAASVSGSTILLGATGEPANLVFAASSTIEGAGTGQLITIGANSDVVDFGVNVGIGTTTPWAKLAISGNSGDTNTNLFLVSSSTPSATTTAFVVTNAGNIGIGTTTPGSIFSINGVANWTTATSTYYSTGGINLTAGCFSINGTCITGGGGGVSLSGANTWTALQQFASGASSTNISLFNNLFIGGSATTTLQGNTAGTSTIQGFLNVAGTNSTSTFSGGLAASYLNLTGSIATSSAANGFNLTAGCFSINGNCIGNSIAGNPAGSNGQIQFNSSGSFGGSSNFVFTNPNVGIGGTTTPSALLTLSAYSGETNPYLFLIASSTPSATSTLFSIDNKGDLISTLAASSTFVVGPNGATNPAFQIFASTTNAATGIAIISQRAGNGVALQAISSGATEALTISAAGNQELLLNPSGGSTIIDGNASISGGVATFAPTASGGSAVAQFAYNNGSYINVPANSEKPDVYFNLLNNVTVSHTNDTAGNNIAIQRDFRITGAEQKFASYSVLNNIGNLVALSVDPSFVGVNDNGTTTNNIGLQVTSQALNASTTNAYGLQVTPSTGAQNTYAGLFNGLLDISGVNGSILPSNDLFLISSSTAGATTTLFNVLNTGNATLAGTLTQNSDQRLKANIQNLDASSSLAAINALNPVSFNWIGGMFGSGEQLGFIAQDVQEIFPQLVSTTSPTVLTPNGTLGLNYSGLISPMVSAIQALSTELASIENSIAGFAQSFTSAIGNFGQVNTNELCMNKSDGAPICVTGDQLAALLASQSLGQGSDGPAGSDAGTAPETPPIIQINGDNPAVIEVGATYNDLGATIEGPPADLNLGITTFVNGIEMSPVQIDTSAAATDTIAYVVTDQNGLTATSTRTVIIEASPSVVPGDAAATTATTTTLTDPAPIKDTSTLSASNSTASTTENTATTTTP